MIMVVTDKESEIAILRTLGKSPGGVMRVFIVLGTFIGILGTLLGGVGGVTLAANVEVIVGGIEKILGTKFLP
jgi:lipoprotein-releasing system permease protein